jgi:hypothetical protein
MGRQIKEFRLTRVELDEELINQVPCLEGEMRQLGGFHVNEFFRGRIMHHNASA